MSVRTLGLSSMVLAAMILAANVAWALGFGLRETKEELKLDYEVSAKDNGTGRVTVVLTIADEGRLEPLSSVQLVIPNNENIDRSGPPDLSVALETREESGKQIARVHVLRELAERAEIQLRTGHLDGKQQVSTWYFHTIPIADYLEAGEQSED